MNGAKRETDLMARSIAAATISSTSPAARIANGAKYGSSVTKFAWVKKRSVLTVKYSAASRVTTTMLPSRSVRKRSAISRGRLRRFSGPAGGDALGAAAASAGDAAGACSSVRTSLMRERCARLRRGHAGRRRRALVAALRVVVRADRRLVEELQAGVDVGDARQRVRDLVHVQLQHRQEALQVRLLVDREVDLVAGQQLLGDRREVVAAALDALLAQVVLLDRLGEALRAAGVDGEVALRVRMAGRVGVDHRQLGRDGRACRDDVRLDARVGLEGLAGAVDARLDVRRARRRDEQRDVAGGHELRDALAHLLAGDEQVLADVRQAGVARGVGVVGDDGDLGL